MSAPERAMSEEISIEIDCCRGDKQDFVGHDFDEPFWIKVVKMLAM